MPGEGLKGVSEVGTPGVLALNVRQSCGKAILANCRLALTEVPLSELNSLLAKGTAQQFVVVTQNANVDLVRFRCLHGCGEE